MVCGVCESNEEPKKVDGVAVVLKDYEERRTTDSLFLLVLIALWVAMTIVGAMGLKGASIQSLIRPYDSDGNFCGVDKKEAEPYMYYIRTNPFPIGNCVNECPTVTVSETSVKKTDYVCYPAATFAKLTDAEFDASLKSTCWATDKYSKGINCYCAPKEKSTILFDRCVQTEISNDNSAASYMKKFVSDVYTARAVIFGFGFCIAIAFGFLYTYLMSKDCFAWIIVWSCVTGVLAVGVATALYGQNLANKWKNESPEVHTSAQRTWLDAFNYTVLGLSVIWFLLMLWFRKAINMAIKCVSMGAKALEEMPLLIFIPIIQMTGLILFFIPWFLYSAGIASKGEFVTRPAEGLMPEIKYWQVDEDAKVAEQLWFLLFVLLWTINFIANIGSLVIAHSVCCWYFTKPEDRKEKIGNHNIYSSYKLVMRFHLGTVALGSLIIAIIQYARAVALYMQKNVSEKFRSKPWVKIIFCCINCCLWCLECCMKFISKNAYIQTAIYGTPFWASAKGAFSLIASNIMRIGAIMVTSGGALFIGKIFVTALATICTYFFLGSSALQKNLYDPVGPLVLTALIAWMTATMFMDVLNMAIDTIFQCFISDEVSNNGVAAFGGDSLKSFVDENGKMEKEDGCCADDDSTGDNVELNNNKE
jgi:choline transporter-like protein 2/4/5